MYYIFTTYANCDLGMADMFGCQTNDLNYYIIAIWRKTLISLLHSTVSPNVPYFESFIQKIPRTPNRLWDYHKSDVSNAVLPKDVPVLV